MTKLFSEDDEVLQSKLELILFELFEVDFIFEKFELVFDFDIFDKEIFESTAVVKEDTGTGLSLMMFGLGGDNLWISLHSGLK